MARVDEQADGWARVADAVHARGGTVVMQVMHGGRVSHTDITGTDRIQPIGARWPRLAPVSVTFGEPMTFPEHRGQAGKGKARREVTDQVMEAIAELSGQEKAGWGKPSSAA